MNPHSSEYFLHVSVCLSVCLVLSCLVLSCLSEILNSTCHYHLTFWAFSCDVSDPCLPFLYGKIPATFKCSELCFVFLNSVRYRPVQPRSFISTRRGSQVLLIRLTITIKAFPFVLFHKGCKLSHLIF